MHPFICAALNRMGLSPKTPSIVTKIIFPTLHITESTAFYERLGFTVENYDDGYAWVNIEGRELFHLAHTPEMDVQTNHAAGYFHVQDVNDVYQRWGPHISVVAPLGDQPWGMREFSFRDPSNNLIRVGQFH